MVKSTKEFKANFYQCFSHIDDTDGKKFSAIIASINKEWLSSNDTYGCNIIEKGSDYFFGELKKYRDDPPHIGKPNETEREIDLEADEHVIEKSYFVYMPKYKVVLLQMTDTFRSPKYFMDTINANVESGTCFAAHMLDENAAQRAAQNQYEVTKVECAIAIPQASRSTPKDQWGQAAVILSDNAAGNLQFTITGNMRGSVKSPIEPSLLKKVIDGAKSGFLSKAKIVPYDGEPIDLLNEKLRTTISPSMAGRYPLQGSIKDELIRAIKEYSSVLESY
jgi:hypothetical protein